MVLQMEATNHHIITQVQGHGHEQSPEKSGGDRQTKKNGGDGSVNPNAIMNGNGLVRTKSIGSVKDLGVTGAAANNKAVVAGVSSTANTNARSNNVNSNSNISASASANINTNANASTSNAQTSQSSQPRIQFVRSTSIKVERKVSSKRTTKADDENMEDSVEILSRMISVADPTNTRGLDELCLNCGRDVRVEGEAYVTDIGKFCGKNCHWSVLLDESNLRSRTQPTRTRNVTMNTQGQPGMAMSKTSHAAAMRAAASMQEYSHAIYQYQQEFEGSRRGGLSRKGSIKLGQQSSQ